MRFINSFSNLFLLTILTLSCVSYKAKYRHPTIKEYNAITEEPKFTLYLIGDAGNAPSGKTTPLLKTLKNDLSEQNNKSAIVWLGDNIYPVGLSPELDEDYNLGKHRILKQLECLDQYNGLIYFIPGNHDWYKYGAEGIQRQEQLIENYLSNRKQKNKYQNNYFIPDNACGKINVSHLDDEKVLILMDSNWFLLQDRQQFEHCDHSSREYFKQQLRDSIRHNIDKQIIVCLHHPPYTYGSHGSHFPFKDNFFPLTQVKSALWIPLPIAGFVFNNMRGFFTEQDSRHYAYKQLKSLLEEELSKAKNPIVASGHEHNLQHIFNNGIEYIVSGAGSKKNPIKLGEHSEFAIGEKGFVKIYFLEKTIVIDYLINSEDGINIKVIFRKIINKD